MSNSSIPVIKFAFSGEFRVLNETLAAQPTYQVEEFSAVNDLLTYLSTEAAGLVIASLRDKNDLVQIATLMKLIKKVAKDTTLKIVVINFSGDKQFEKAVAKLGIQDLVEPAINAKALKFKLDFWIKSLTAQIKNNPNANAQKSVKAEAKTVDKKSTDLSAPIWSEPLDLEDDIWIIKNDADCKKILSKWLIRLMGPSPYIGQWNDVQNNLWRFEIKSAEKEMYVPGSGHWYFHGDAKPDFVWKENIWLLTGDSFDLFYKDGSNVVSRLKAKDKILTVAKNSLFAKTKEQIIIESFDKEMLFRKEAQSLDDLEGQGKTDSINGGPLSGKNKTSHLNNGPLSGEVNPADQLLNSEALSQKASNDQQSSFWQGKNSYGKEGRDGKGPASEGLREGSSLEQDIKNSQHQKYYKNHNEAEKYEADKNGNLSGKSSTDQLDGYYDNDNAKKDSATQNGPMDGKSSTDQIDGHYKKAKLEGTGVDEKEKRQREEAGAQSKREAEKASSEANRTRTAMNGIQESTSGKGTLASSKTHDEKADTKEQDQANDPYEALFGKSKERQAPAASQNKKNERPVDADYAQFDDSFLDPSEDENQSANLADVISLQRTKAEKLTKDALAGVVDPDLEEASADAKLLTTMSINKLQINCNLDDFFDEAIIFTTKDNSIAPSSKVDLDMSFKYMNKDTQIKMAGEVITIEGDGEGSNYVTVQLSKDNVEAFEKFMQLYRTRQANASAFLKKVQGL